MPQLGEGITCTSSLSSSDDNDCNGWLLVGECMLGSEYNSLS